MRILKSSIAVFIAALMLVSVFTVCAGAVPVECPYAAVRGTLPNCDWDGAYDELNTMTIDEKTGLYTITYDNVPKGDYRIKVMYYDGYYTIDDLLYVPVTMLKESDLTITFDPGYFDGYFFGKVDFYGTYVTKTENSDFQSAGVLADFKPTDWATFSSVNMNEIAKHYYTLTFDNVAAGDYEYLFVCNRSYFKSFYAEEGKEYELSGNCVFRDQYSNNDNKFKLHVGENDKYVTFTLDLRNFDVDTQKGAVYSVTLSETEPAEPTVPELPTEATEETTTVPEQTTVPVETTIAPIETTEPVETTSATVETTEAVETTTATAETTEAVEATTVPQTTAWRTTCPTPPRTIVTDKKTVANKKANPIKVSAKTKSVKLKKLKNKDQKIKAVTIKNAKGNVNCKIVKAAKIKKFLKINSDGVITFKNWKKAKKGTYKVTVRVNAKGNKKYNAKTISKALKIKVN